MDEESSVESWAPEASAEAYHAIRIHAALTFASGESVAPAVYQPPGVTVTGWWMYAVDVPEAVNVSDPFCASMVPAVEDHPAGPCAKSAFHSVAEMAGVAAAVAVGDGVTGAVAVEVSVGVASLVAVVVGGAVAVGVGAGAVIVRLTASMTKPASTARRCPDIFARPDVQPGPASKFDSYRAN
jgi:hypothetical protein